MAKRRRPRPNPFAQADRLRRERGSAQLTPKQRKEQELDSALRSRRTTRIIGLAGALCLVGATLLLVFGDQLFSSSSSKSSPTTDQPTDTSDTSTSSTASTTQQANVADAKKETIALAALRGKVIGIDPGHNGQNSTRVNRISRLVTAGSSKAPCDEIGVELQLDGGTSQVTESALTMSVAKLVRQQLEDAGATVRLTRRNDDGWGPCVDKRASILSGTDAAVSLHTNVATSRVRGFAVRLADPDADNRGAVRAEDDRKLALSMSRSWRDNTGLQPTSSAGADGIVQDGQIVLLNLVDSPIIQLEMGNLTNAKDRSILTEPADADRLAKAVVIGLAEYLSPAKGTDQ